MLRLKGSHGIIILAIAAAAAGVLLYFYLQRVAWDGYEYKGTIVKTQSTVPLVKTPGDDMSDSQGLQAGTRVGVTGVYEDWLFVHTKNGKEGWVRKTFVTNIVKAQDIIDARFNFKQAVEAQQQKETKP